MMFRIAWTLPKLRPVIQQTSQESRKSGSDHFFYPFN
jgi:hypothetical protein